VVGLCAFRAGLCLGRPMGNNLKPGRQDILSYGKQTLCRCGSRLDQLALWIFLFLLCLSEKPTAFRVSRFGLATQNASGFPQD